jgi:hypothetical protein
VKPHSLFAGQPGDYLVLSKKGYVMKPFAKFALCLLVAMVLCLAGCNKKSPPQMPLVPNPAPAVGASAQEMERYQLEEEKRSLAEKYGDNIDRIQQINARLIQLNIDISRQTNSHN